MLNTSGTGLNYSFNPSGTSTPTPGVNPDTQQSVENIENKARGGGNFQWGDVFGLLGTGIENSDKLASTFSGKYRDDQIALAQAQAQGGFFGSFNGVPTFGQPQNNNQKFILIGIVAVVVIVLVALMMRKK